VEAGYEPGVATPEGLDPRPFLPGVRGIAAPGSAEVRLVLARAGTVTLRALDGLDDRPLSFVHALLLAEDGRVLFDRPVATIDGEVRLEGIPPAGATLYLFSRRHRLVRGVAVSAGDVTEVGAVRLARGIHVTGKVTDLEGRPVAGAHVAGMEADRPDPSVVDPVAEREHALRTTVAGEDGAFVLDGLDPRRPARLAAWSPGLAPTSRRFALPPFQESAHAQVDLALREGGLLVVDLVEADTERAVAGAVFDLEDVRGGAAWRDVVRRARLLGVAADTQDWLLASESFLYETGAPGRYRIGPAEPGPYVVWVGRPGYRPLTRRLTILDPSEGITDLGAGSTRTLADPLTLTWAIERD
jgi:hypothetical protein